jgi:hypothetical protein
MAKNFPAKKNGAPVTNVKPKVVPKATTAAPNPAAGGKSAIHPDSVLGSLKVPPQFNQAFIGATKSVMHFVTAPATHKMFLNGLAGPGPAAQKLAEGVENLLKIVVHQSKGQFPPNIYLAVGMYAISWIGDYVMKSKLLPVDEKDIATAMQMFLHTTFMGLKTAQQAPPAPKAPPGQPGQPGPGAPNTGSPTGAPMGQPGPALPKMTAAPAQAPGSQPNMGPGAAPGPQGLLNAKMG